MWMIIFEGKKIERGNEFDYPFMVNLSDHLFGCLSNNYSLI